METELKHYWGSPSHRSPRVESPSSQSGTRARIVRGDAPFRETFVLEVPCVHVVFQYDGLPLRVEWRCSDSAVEDCCAADEPRTRGETTISVHIDEPNASVTAVELEGLVLVDSGGSKPRRLEPYQITDMLNLGRALSTTDRSVISYRIYDHHGVPVGTGMTKVAASFKADASLHLFFRYTDVKGGPGHISIFADADEAPDAHSTFENVVGY